MKMHLTPARGFTIVELLIVIVIIGILASLVVTGFSGIKARSVKSTQQAELTQIQKAIMSSRISQDKTLGQLTGNYWSLEPCTYIWDGGNTTNTVPSQLPKNGPCWQAYYTQLDALQQASGVNLQQLKKGDPNGNPYYIDENEEEPRFGCTVPDMITVFTNTNADIDFYQWRDIPFHRCQ